jgi:predicted patatin/cPLA2 family phospholipase
MDKGLAFVLEGGAMRGMFTAGVLDALWGKVAPETIVATSAGALFGCNWKSAQPGRVIRYNKRWARDWRYCSLASWLFTGDLFGAKFCYGTLPKKLDKFDTEAFRANPVRFFLTATDIDSGTGVLHECRDGGEEDLRWMRAGASMPLVSRPVEIAGKKYLDGGITDAIPLESAARLGCTRFFVVLTQPREYRKTTGGEAKWVARFMGKRHPALAEAMRKRADMYNAQAALVAAAEAEGKAFAVRPETSLGISRTERRPDELQRVYDLGLAAGEKALPALLAWLGR